MKHYACLKIVNDYLPRNIILDEFVEYASKLPISDDQFQFQEIQHDGITYIGIEIEHHIKPHFPLEKISI